MNIKVFKARTLHAIEWDFNSWAGFVKPNVVGLQLGRDGVETVLFVLYEDKS